MSGGISGVEFTMIVATEGGPAAAVSDPATLKRVNCDNAGNLQVGLVAGGDPFPVLTYGQGGSAGVNYPMNYTPLGPQAGVGFRQTIGAVSQTLGPIAPRGKIWNIIVTKYCWVRVGPVGLGAAIVGNVVGSGDTPLAPGEYLYVPKTGLDYISFIRDTSEISDGVIMIGQVEA